MPHRRRRILPARTNAVQPSRFVPSKSEMFYTHVGRVPKPDQTPRSAQIQYGSVAASAARAEENFAASQFTNQITPSHALPPAPLNESPATGDYSQRPPDFYRHARLCTVCNHPERDAIDADFVRWQSPEKIAADYQIADRSTIYRHAHSTGLFLARRRELPRVLETILESGGNISLESMDVITRAVRAYAHLGDDGKWFEAPKTMYILTGSAPAALKPENDPLWRYR
jgi:hypothetical protein